jgi:tetratricopeptide (TPR) repeat protein
MPGEKYLLLLNDALKKYLLALPDRERRRLREKLDFLETGFWDAGVRVKKLKGTAARVVFEARMDRGDRLLFTLGSHRGRTAIYVWGISRHDAVPAAAARIVPLNAPFLDFEPLEREDRSELVIDTLPRAWLSQEDVEQKVPEDYGPQKWLVLDEGEWQRLLSSPDPDGFEAFLFLTREQEDLLRAKPPVLLSGTAGSGKTTLAVYYLVRGAGGGSHRLFLTYNPLLRGLAERIYNGLVFRQGDVPAGAAPRFMVFRDLLREITHGVSERFPAESEVGLVEFTQIFNDHPSHRGFDPELVWEEIRSIVKGSKMPLNPPRLARLAARFAARQMSWREREELGEYLLGIQNLTIARPAEAFIARKSSLGGYQGFLRSVATGDAESARECDAVLQELLRLVAGSEADFTSPLLSAEEYFALGRKRAPSFIYDRREIYRIAEYYQERLGRSGRWDEIDLTKAALQLLDDAREEFSWDLVICDEVQDLTDVQIALLFRLAANPQSIVLTGDPRQIINPSGFRWEEVKNKLYDRGLPVPPIHRLSLNFRCVGSIVRFSNALLDLKAALVGLSDAEMREEWKFNGRPPLLLAGIDEREALAHLEFRGAGQVILTRNADERDRLKAALGTELIFTIAEAKGLEFETVLVWRFCADEQASRLWKGIAAGHAVEQSRVPHLRHELALLYVAVTRARSCLIIFDGRAPSVIWDIESLASLVFRTSEVERLAKLVRPASAPAEWESQGDYYLLREHYAAAAECFRNAGAAGKQANASALLLMKKGQFADAAPLFETAGEKEKAAECHTRAGGWQAAMRLWQELGRRREALECSARLHEEAREHTLAAEEWEKLGEHANALANWEKAGAFDRVGRALAAAGQHERAAAVLEKAGLFREAAVCWVKAGRGGRAADLYFRAGDLKTAATLYRKNGDDEKYLRCLRQMGDFPAIALFHQKRGDARKAVEAFTAFAAASDSNRAALREMIPPVKTRRSALTAAIMYCALGMPESAGPLFVRGGEYLLAVRELEKAGDLPGLVECYQKMGRYLEAANVVERIGLPTPVMIEEIEDRLYRHLEERPGEEEKAVEALHAEALRMLSEGRLAGAAARFRLLQDDARAVEALRGLGFHEMAIGQCLEAGNPRMAVRYAKHAEVAVRAAYVEAIVAEVFSKGAPAGEERAHLVELVFLLLARSPADSFPSDPRGMIESIFAAIFHGFFLQQSIPAPAYEILINFRVANVIIVLLYDQQLFHEAPAREMLSFMESLQRVARETADPDLRACAAFLADPEEFENVVRELGLADANVRVLGMSSERYREAVALLMAAGRISEAETFCRMHDDVALAATYAEKRGDHADAARLFTAARDHASALRCYEAAGDKRGMARTLERLGRREEAIALWESFGNSREVERLRRKR